VFTLHSGGYVGTRSFQASVAPSDFLPHVTPGGSRRAMKVTQSSFTVAGAGRHGRARGRVSVPQAPVRQLVQRRACMHAAA
jgi:hypothetical protein